MDLMTYLLATQNGGGSGLPEVTSADNGKILKVKDGEWEPGEDISGDKLPPVSSADNGKVLKVVDAEWNIGEDEGDRLPFVTGADEGKVLKVNDQGHWEAEEEDPELPATTSADEGKILKVDSNGDWSKGDETTELPSVSSSDNGKVLKVTEGQWAKGDAPESIQVGNATGDIVSFNDGADNILMPKLMVDIQPKQDLHGYDSPWAGGAGKNILPVTLDGIKSLNTSGTWSGNVYTSNNVKYTIETDDGGNVVDIKVNGTASALETFRVGVMQTSGNLKVVGCPQGGDFTNGYSLGVFKPSVGTVEYDEGNGTTFEFNGANEEIRIIVRQDTQCNNLIFKPMVSADTSVTYATFAPYSNICPISGWTACNVSVCGENLFNKDASDKTISAYLNHNTGTTTASDNWNTSGYIPAKQNQNYVLSGYNNLAPSNFEICFYDSNKTFISGLNQNTFTFTSPSGTVYIRIDYKKVDENTVQLQFGSTPSSYVPYATPHTYTINFVDGSNPLIVYGGTLDVLSGVLTVDRAYVNMGDLSWTKPSNYTKIFYAQPSNVKIGVSGQIQTICSQYPSVACNDFSTLDTYYDKVVTIQKNASSIVAVDSGYSSASDFKTAMNGVQLVYELATPQTYQLTPTEVKSLLENNVIYADAGKVTVTYYKHSEALEDMDILFSKLPKVTNADNGKILQVNNGAWAKGDSDAYVALTQAQYDALPSSKLTDGKMYYITDQDGNVVTQSPTITNADYEVLFSGSADNTEHTESARKSDGFLYNPSKKSMTIGSRQPNTTTGSNSFEFGNLVTASGPCSYAEGSYTTASGDVSHAEGGSTIASGDRSHAEGENSIASGTGSHAECIGATASGYASHAEGVGTIASGSSSHAEGWYTIANHESQHTFGQFNTLDNSQAAATERGNYIEIVGNGTTDNARSNARTLDWSGNEWVAGTYTNGSSRKIKTNIESLTNTEALKILDLNPVKFDFIKTETNDQRERGFIAEEVMNVIPQIAFEEITDDEGNIIKPASLNYIGLIPYLVKMIQIQQQEIDELKEQINN
jgi:hypothetical protein